MKTSIVPKGTRILIKQDTLDNRYGKIEIVREHGAAEQAKINTGVVVAIGDDAWDRWESDWAKVGDHVIFAEYAGRSLRDEKYEEVFLIMSDSDIIAVIDETEDNE